MTGSSVAGAWVTRPSPWRVNRLATPCHWIAFVAPSQMGASFVRASVSWVGVVTLQVFLARQLIRARVRVTCREAPTQAHEGEYDHACAKCSDAPHRDQTTAKNSVSRVAASDDLDSRQRDGESRATELRVTVNLHRSTEF